ncbi:hypothetical protein Gorai_009925 [Gossypium raimondii]|uniref:DFDF domain-containing protein n=1 Tax=Gossypium raimondii TaxID=29730 RepID=A0A7J8PV23_GOSRA|nr:hypothetical protein [Gossypium raimondii]
MELPFNLAMVIEDMKEEEEEELGLNHFILACNYCVELTIWSSRPVTKFTEDFDFVAMNEKFKKDEVWGHLGNSSKSHTKDKEADAVEEYGSQDEDDAEISKIQTKSGGVVQPVYNKDDFFDTLSCNALDSDLQNGRPRFSEQMKLDTETFGDFSRHRGGRGRGRGPGRGRGGRFRGGYYGRGYGYVGRGRG